MILAELNVRHTRRHMPTRRVALDDGYLPTSGSAYGAVLLGAVRRRARPRPRRGAARRSSAACVDAARGGLAVPRIALRYRLQTDTHGLDRSRHRITDADVAAGSTARARARPARPGRAAGDRRGDGGGRRSRRPDARSRSASSTRRSRRPGFLPEGLEVRRLLPGPARAPAVPARRAGTRQPSGGRRRVARRAVGAAVGDGGARACARTWRSSATTCSAGSGASSASRTPTTVPSAAARPSASPSSARRASSCWTSSTRRTRPAG